MRKKSEDPKAMVLMNRKTGDLFEAYRITFMDQMWCDDIQPHGAWSIKVGVFQHDGWIITHPGPGPHAIFMNRHCEKFFKNIGDL